MKTRVCLILLSLLGVALIFAPRLGIVFPPVDPLGGSSAYRLWKESLSLFAIPLSLFLLSLKSSFLIRALSLLWGLWMVSLAATTLIVKNPPLDLYPMVGAGLSILFALGLFLFSYMDLFTSLDTKKRAKEA